MIITIDGPVGTGKSTIAKRLAERLGFSYFDTGAMYRCLTYGFLKHHISLDDSQQIEQFLKNFEFEVKTHARTKHYYFEGEDITDSIRQEEVASYSSTVSALAAVRKKCVDIQRKLGQGTDAVFEGRDMGTVVFPEAEFKVFLTADAKIRAARRYDELIKKFPQETENITFEKVLTNLQKRDTEDFSRKISPLKPAEEAHIIDTSSLTIEEILDQILAIVHSAL